MIIIFNKHPIIIIIDGTDRFLLFTSNELNNSHEYIAIIYTVKP